MTKKRSRPAKKRSVKSFKIQKGEKSEKSVQPARIIISNLNGRFENRRLIFLLSFILPCAVMICIYAAEGIAPFGDKTLLATDMDVQYSSFFSYLHRVLLGEESLFYSFQKGAGGNMWGLFTYYLSSPFFLLAAFFPNSAMPEGIALITVLKVSAAGLTFAIFLDYISKRHDLTVLMFSVVYALSQYAMRYALCIMWLDACIWLPIMLLGTERVLEGKSPLTFILSCSALMISNYYTCYMASVFTILFFIFRIVTREEKFNIHAFLKKTGIMLGAAVLSVALCAFILLPSFLDMQSGKFVTKSYVANGFWNLEISNLPRRLFIGQTDKLTNVGNPPIFCGALCGLCTAVYFFNSNVKLKEKLAALAVYAVLIVSFLIKRVDMVWHIFNYPNWFPYRYAFVFCFFSVFISFFGFVRLNGASRCRCVIGAAVYLAVLAGVWLFWPSVLTDKKIAALSFAFAAGYIVLICLKTLNRRAATTAASVALIAVCCVEMGFGGFYELKNIDTRFHYTSRSTYAESIERDSAAAELLNAGDGFYRAEKAFRRTDNDPMSYGYNGLAHYSSNFNALFNKFNSNTGMLQEWFASRQNGSTILTDSILGIKKIAALAAPNDEYSKVASAYNFAVYDNPLALSIGFTTSEDALLAPSAKDGKWLTNQDDFAQKVIGERFYSEPLDLEFLQDDRTFAFTSSGKPVYVALSKKYSGGASVIVNGTPRTYSYDSDTKKVWYIGEFKSGERVSVTLSSTGYLSGGEVREFDAAAFEKEVSKIKDGRELDVTDFGNTYIEGNITSSGENTVLFTSIPYENGWSAYIDGEKTEIAQAYGAFCAVPLTIGEHTVRLVFRCPGMRLGATISLIALAVLIAALFLRKFGKINLT